MVDEADGKSVWFEGVLAPLGPSPAGATVSLSVDLAFGAFAGHTLLEYGTRDLVCFDQEVFVGFDSWRKSLDMYGDAMVLLDIDSYLTLTTTVSTST